MANDFPSSRNPYFSTQRNARSSLNGFSWKPRPRLSLIAGKQTSKNQFFANLPLARNIKHPWNLSVINFLPARVIVEGKHVDGIFNSLKKTIELIIDILCRTIFQVITISLLGLARFQKIRSVEALIHSRIRHDEWIIVYFHVGFTLTFFFIPNWSANIISFWKYFTLRATLWSSFYLYSRNVGTLTGDSLDSFKQHFLSQKFS